MKDLFFYKTRGTPLFQAAVELKEKAVLLRIADKINRFCRWLSIVSWFHSGVGMYIRKNESLLPDDPATKNEENRWSYKSPDALVSTHAKLGKARFDVQKWWRKC